MVKCKLCSEEIKNTFLEKLDGTIVRVKTEDKTELVHVCSSCQKKFKDTLRKEVEKVSK